MSVFVETTGDIKKAELKWDFPNVTSLEWQMKNPGESIFSPDFHADGDDEVKWYIKICPNREIDEDKGWITALLHPRFGSTSKTMVNVKFTFTAVFDKERKKVWSRTKERTFGSTEPYINGHGWGIVKLATILKSNFFSLVCQLEYADPKPTTKISVLPSPSVPLSNEELTSSLSQNLEHLFNIHRRREGD